MKSFRLTNTGAEVWVDDVDFDYVTKLCTWSDDGNGYARSSKLFGKNHALLHRVIAEHAGMDIDGKHVHHDDENPLHNWRDNLIVKSPSQHTTDHNNTRVWPTGENHGNTRLTDVELLDVIRSVMQAGGTQRDMAAMLDISIPHMGDVVHGRRRPDLLPTIETIIKETGWREGNKSNTDEETLELVADYLKSGMSATAYAKASGKISRQHLNNVLTGVRLPHLQERIRGLIK